MADDKDKQDQESLKAVQAQNETAKELLSTYEKLKKVKGSLTQDEKDTLNISKQLVGYSSTLEKSINQRVNGTASIKDLSKTINQLQKEYNENLRNSDDIVKNLNKGRREAAAKIREASEQERQLKAKIQELDEHVLAAEIDKQVHLQNGNAELAKQAAQTIKENQRIISQKEKELQKITQQKEEQQSLVKQLGETKKAHDEIIKQQKQELELAKEELKVKQKQELLQDALKKGQSTLNALGLEQLTQAFTLSGLFKMMIEGAFKVDKQTTQLSKSLGVSKEYTEKMRNDMFAYAQASEDGFLNTDRLYKAQQGLTEQLGIAVDFGREEQETFARLTEITGLTADEAGKLAKNSAAAGMSTKEYLADIREGVSQAQLSTKTHVEEKKILQDISKLSAGILVKFQGNPKAIAQAVVEANKLGLSLDKVDKIGDSLLDWESSINNELEAELITGKKINLERAREAALTGDQATLMQEIASQAGSLEDFQKMNVIAQGSLAKAFGMTREEMSDMLMKQEAINKYGDKAADLNKEQLDYMEKHGMNAEQMQKHLQNQRDTQEKFNDAMLKLQDIVSQLVAGPFGKLLGIIASILGNTTALSAIMAIYITRLGVMLTLKTRELLLSKKTAQTDATDASIAASKSAALTPGGFLIAAGVAATLFAVLSGMLSKGDDVISPGYGKRMLLDKGSITAFNDQDTIMAGTDLFGGKSKPNANAGIMAAVTSAIANQKPPVVNVGGNISLDGENVGKMIGRQNVTGTEQTKNTYKVA